MRRAVKRDAVHGEMFYFRKSVVPDGDEEDELLTTTDTESTEKTKPTTSIDDEYSLMSVNTIINGKVSLTSTHYLQHTFILQ